MKIKCVIFCLAVTFFTFGVIVSSSGEDRNRNVDICVMSFNIRFISDKDTAEFSWDSRKEPIINMFEDVSPDVAGLQEIMTGSADYILSALSGEYDAFLQYRDGDGIVGKQGRSHIILWKRNKYKLVDHGRFWLSETPDCPSKGWDASQLRFSQWVKLKDNESGKEFYLLNTHIDHKGKQAKENGCDLNVSMLQEIAGEKSTVFVVGDMNIQRHKSNGYYLDPYYIWMSSARDDAEITCERPSFSGFGYPEKNPAWLDHIFYRHASASRFDVIDDRNYGVEYISDHYPIICEFKF